MDIVCAETDAAEGAGGVEGVADGVDIVDGVVVAEGGVDGLDGWGLVCAITAPPISDEANDATINFFMIFTPVAANSEHGRCTPTSVPWLSHSQRVPRKSGSESA